MRRCPQGFYMMQINPDGKVVPCCSMKYPVILGDVNRNTVPEIWAGDRFNQFRRGMLEDRTRISPVCRDCKLYLYDLHPEDVLDEVRESLMKKYMEGLGENS